MSETPETPSHQPSPILNEAALEALYADMTTDVYGDLLKARQHTRLFAIATCVMAMLAGVFAFQSQSGPQGAMAGERVTPSTSSEVTPPADPEFEFDPIRSFETQPSPTVDPTLWTSPAVGNGTQEAYEPTSTTTTNGYMPGGSTGSTGQ